MNPDILKRLWHTCATTKAFGLEFNNRDTLTNILTIDTMNQSMHMPAEIWRSGSRPPFVGWWKTRRLNCLDCWRFWNGDFWSAGCVDHMPAGYAARQGETRIGTIVTTSPNGIIYDMSWCWSWPNNCRVPRIEPLAFEIIKRKLPQFEDWTINQFLERIAK